MPPVPVTIAGIIVVGGILFVVWLLFSDDGNHPNDEP